MQKWQFLPHFCTLDIFFGMFSCSDPRQSVHFLKAQDVCFHLHQLSWAYPSNTRLHNFFRNLSSQMSSDLEVCHTVIIGPREATLCNADMLVHSVYHLPSIPASSFARIVMFSPNLPEVVGRQTDRHRNNLILPHWSYQLMYLFSINTEK